MADTAARLVTLDDLRAPERTRAQTVALAATARFAVTLTTQAVMEAARRQTGLDDFGSLDFIPRLACWLQATEEDANASSFARTNMYQLAVRCAANRLRLEDFIARHPQVLDIAIDRPVFVAGTPRSGTTYLLELLAADPRFRALRWWEAIAPIPGPADAPNDADPNPRRTRAAANWRAWESLLPAQRLMHEFSADHVAEDIDLHVLDFSSYFIEWSIYPPRWRDLYLATDQRATYAYARRALQALTYLHGPNRWLLKCPQHMEQLAVIRDVFPDATIVLTHRDPVAAVRSAMVMALYTARVTRTRVDPAEPLGWWPDRYRTMLTRCVADRDTLDPARTIDAYFHEWIADPDTLLRRIYEAAGMTVDDALIAGLHQRSAEHHKRSAEKLVYDLERDFGVTADSLASPFGFYYDRFPVRREPG